MIKLRYAYILTAVSLFFLNAQRLLAATPTFKNPLGDGVTVYSSVANVVELILGFVGALALIMFIYGSLTWMTSMGNDQQIAKGKNILTWATLGMIVVFSSYALIRFVFEAIGV